LSVLLNRARGASSSDTPVDKCLDHLAAKKSDIPTLIDKVFAGIA
jgi:hypothetical protein